MSIRTLNIEWAAIKSYATEKALMKRLNEEATQYPGYNDRAVVVRNPEGRWTAIISLDMTQGGYVGRYSFLKI